MHPTQPPPRVWWFVLASIANLVHNITFQLFFHLPAYLEEQGRGEFAIGVIMAAMPLAAILVRPTVGRWIDERGRKQVILIGSVLHVIAPLSYCVLVDSLVGVFLCRLIHGAALGVLFSALFTMAADLSPPGRRAQAIGFFGVAGMAALLVSGWIGDRLIEAEGYVAVFIAAALFSLVGLIAMIPVPESRPEPVSGETRSSFRLALTHAGLRPLWWLGITYSVAIAACTTFVKTATLDSGVGSMTLFFGGFGLAAATLRLGFGWVPDRFGPRRCLVPSLFFTAAGLICVAAAVEDYHIAVAGVLTGVGHGFVFPCLSALVIQRASDGMRGSAMSAFTALFDFGMLFGAPLLGLLVETSGYPAMFHSAAVFVILSGLVFLRVDRVAAPAPTRAPRGAG